MHDVHNFLVNNFIYTGLNQLRLVARETNFSPSPMPKLSISRHYAYKLNSQSVVTWI